MVPENIHTCLHGKSFQILGGRGLSRAKIFKENIIDAKYISRGVGRMVDTRKPSMGGIGIFAGTAHCCKRVNSASKYYEHLNVMGVFLSATGQEMAVFALKTGSARNH